MCFNLILYYLVIFMVLADHIQVRAQLKLVTHDSKQVQVSGEYGKGALRMTVQHA